MKSVHRPNNATYLGIALLLALLAIGCGSTVILTTNPMMEPVVLVLREAGIVAAPTPNTRTLPLYPGAVVIADTQTTTLGSTLRRITLRTDAASTQVLAFYDHTLLAGWHSDASMPAPANTHSFVWDDAPRFVYALTIETAVQGTQTEVQLLLKSEVAR